MRPIAVTFAVALCCLTGAAEAAQHVHRPPAKTLDEIVERNVAARGGLEAWRKVETMVWLGHLERGNAPDGQPMRYVMQLRRPNVSRFEIKSNTEQFARIFDGKRGWKVRPDREGRPEPQAFSKEEVAFAREEFVIDGPLIDHAAKGVTATYDGIDHVDGHTAYRLTLKLPSGAARNLWIDTTTNLEFRYDRPSTNPLAPGARVSVYYRDFRPESGLQLAHRIDVAAAKGRPATDVADEIVIDRVLVNPPLDAQAFQPPLVPRPHAGRIVVPAAATPEPRPPNG